MTSPNDEGQHTDISDEVEAQFQAIRKTISAQWSEILSAVLLAAVAIGTAWSGFQSAQWGGAFSGVGAFVAENEKLLNFYEGRFRDEFLPAFEAWVAADPVNNPDAPTQPFLMEEYQIASKQEAIELEEEASALFTEGEQANQTSDDYAFSTVLLATVLFFAGIATRFEWQPIRWVLLGIGIMLLVFGVYNLLSLPIARSFGA